MKTKIHMQDQVHNKVDTIMLHNQSLSEQLSLMKLMLFGIFGLLLSIYLR